MRCARARGALDRANGTRGGRPRTAQNLTRPPRETLLSRNWQRRADFIATAEGHEHDATLAGAIAELTSRAAVVKVFGSFPRAEQAV